MFLGKILVKKNIFLCQIDKKVSKIRFLYCDLGYTYLRRIFYSKTFTVFVQCMSIIESPYLGVTSCLLSRRLCPCFYFIWSPDCYFTFFLCASYFGWSLFLLRMFFFFFILVVVPDCGIFIKLKYGLPIFSFQCPKGRAFSLN